jgi:predicted DNA-binding antitoxin AbrB/MazE fold protein
VTLTIEAVFENGVLRPVSPLPLKESERVRLIVQPSGETPNEAEQVVRSSYGMMGWTGDHETLRRIAEAPEFDPQESA